MKLAVLGVVILAALLSLDGVESRPRSEENPQNGDETAKYEVYVPDATGQMSTQMMTLPEIKSLLARQTEGGEAIVSASQDVPSSENGESEKPSVGIADVVSSVQTVMAETMAQLEDEDKPAEIQVQDPVEEAVVDLVPLSDDKQVQPEYIAVVADAETPAESEVVQPADGAEDEPSVQQQNGDEQEKSESAPQDVAAVIEEENTAEYPIDEEISVTEPANVLNGQQTQEFARLDTSLETVEKELEEDEEVEDEVDDEIEEREDSEDEIEGREETEDEVEVDAETDAQVEGREESEDEAEDQEDAEEELEAREDSDETEAVEEEEEEEEDLERSEDSGDDENVQVDEETDESFEGPTARLLDGEDEASEMNDEKPVSYQNVLGEHEHHEHHEHHDHHEHHESSIPPAVFGPVPEGNAGLTATSQSQTKEFRDLTCASNKLAWKVWNNLGKERSVESNDVFSPIALTSALGVAFLGSNGSTADAIDKALGLDQLTSGNPHLYLRNVASDLDSSDYFSSKQSHVIFVNQSVGSISDIFQARVDTLYGAATARSQDELRSRFKSVANILPKSSLAANLEEDADMKSPFSMFSTTYLKVDWPSTAPSGDDDEELINFLNLPSHAQVTGRRLVPVPTVQTNGSFYAGYDPTIDATAVALPLYPVQEGREEQYFSFEPSQDTKDSLDEAGHLSLVLVMPGSGSQFQAGGSGLAALEARLAQDPKGWSNLLKHTSPRHLHVKFPQLARDSHVNLGRALQEVETSSNDADSPANLAELFDPSKADFSAMVPAKSLYLTEISQMVELDINSVASQPDDEELARMNKNRQSGNKPHSKATCPFAAVKKAPPKKPNNKAGTQNKKKPAAAAAGLKTQVKPAAQKAPAKPGQKAPVRPGQKAPAKAGQKAPAKPGQKAPAKPGQKASAKPGKKGPARPGQKAPAKVGQKAPAKPGQKAPARPGQKAPAKPGQKAPAKPGQKAPAKPGQKAPAKPGQKAPAKPGQKAPAKPGQKAPAKPGQKAPARPGQKAPAKPGQKAPAKPGQKAPAKPGQKAPAKPGQKAPAKPGQKAPAKPGQKAPAKPGQKAPAKPGQKAPAKPGQKAPAKPGQKAPTKPGQKAPAKPGQKAPAKPGQKAPAKPGQKAPAKPGQKAPAQAGQKAPAKTNTKKASTRPIHSNLPGKKTTPANKVGAAGKPKVQPNKRPANTPANKTPQSSAKKPANKTPAANAKPQANVAKKPAIANRQPQKSPARPAVAKAPANVSANKPKAPAKTNAKAPVRAKPQAAASKQPQSQAPKLDQVIKCNNKTGGGKQQPQTPARTPAQNNRKNQSHRQTREAPEQVPEIPIEREQRRDNDFQQLVFNRAFLYAVRHNPTGLLMMIGRYVHP